MNQQEMRLQYELSNRALRLQDSNRKSTRKAGLILETVLSAFSTVNAPCGESPEEATRQVEYQLRRWILGEKLELGEVK